MTFNAALGVFTAAPAQDRTVIFDVSSSGVSKAITDWGLDTAWPSPDNMRRGIVYMGADQVDLVRVSFPVNAPLVNGELAPAQLAVLANRISIANLAGVNKPVSMTPDTEAGVDPWFKNGGQVIPSNWVKAMEATQRALKAQGKNLISAAPFNEPDYAVWNQGTIANLYDILGLLQASPEFTGVALAGPSTLSCDDAATWYNPIKDRVTEGTTHQLAGSFDSYAAFFQDVRASGDRAVNEEMHNVVEAIVGAEYGVQTGVWWGSAELTRGSFVKANQGQRLAYAEHRPNWTAAAVYRSPDGSVQAFVGASERQAVTTTYRFVSKDRAVFYDGHGPQRAYTVTIPGGNGYWVDQPNAEKLINITWGADVQPAINGRYVLVNRNSGRVLEVAGASTGSGANLRQNAYAGFTANHQHWDIVPLDSRSGGDYSYFTIRAVHSGKAADLDGWSHVDGANIIQWDAANEENQQWFFEYVGDGWFTIRNRWSGKCLDVASSSTANGANVQQWTTLQGLNQQWRLIPVGAAVEFVAPAAPTGLVATANAVSVALAWNPSPAVDLAGYNVLRADDPAGPWSIVARGLTTTAFTDNSAHQPRAYHYVVQAADRSLNRSPHSAPVNATPSAAPTLVAHLAFEGNALDGSRHSNHAELAGTVAYGGARVGAGALTLNGVDSFVHLPADVVASDQLTVAAWLYWNGGAPWQPVFEFGNDAGQYIILTPDASGDGMYFAISNGEAEQVLTADALPTGQWVHVAVTLGAGASRLYVNGTQVASSSTLTIKPSDLKPVVNYIGKSQFPVPLFNGRIDDFRVYNHALSAVDVASLVAGVPAAPTGLSTLAGPEQVALTWSAVPNATSYTVKVATSVGGPYTLLAGDLTTTVFTHTGLTYGVSYFYTVEASNFAGSGATSASTSATPQSALISDAERESVRVEVSRQANGGTVATVSMSASVPGHTYQLQYTEDLLGVWTDVSAPRLGDGAGFTETHPEMPAAPRAFYRVLIRR